MYRARLTAVLSVLALLPAAGCTAGGGPETVAETESPSASGPVATDQLPEELTGQQPDWSACPAPDSEQGDTGGSPSPLPDGATWECATMKAPVDYSDPGGDTLDLALIRARSTAGDDERIGSLLFNFGGPGGSGVATLPAFGSDYTELAGRYDLVSFDPRGVGASDGLVCLNGTQLDSYFAENLVPTDEAGEQDHLTRLRSFAAACESAAGPLLPHLTTVNTARDMDLMRHVLGDDKLHYFGISYGTQLGGVYAHLFPQRVGRAALDAVVDPTADARQGALAQAEGFQQALTAYMESCAQSEDCPLGGSPDEGERKLNDFLDGLRSTPLPTQDPDGRPLTESLAWSGIAQSLYSEDFWPFLTQGLEEAMAEEDPDGTILLTLGDSMNGRNPDGTYSTLQSSLVAINCADTDQRYEIADVHNALPEFTDASPVFGPGMAWSLLSCTDWPVTGAQAHPDVSTTTDATILLIGTTGDPATPYAGTTNMREALGEDKAVELTYEGEGHGAYNSGNSCVQDTVNAYLLDGKVPEDGKTCS
ncbi:alpha/beta hydrolase [Streptomyces harbinensis]|uniref:TAP-like protein n=1 Tax=Streptomyces harbinensis TaxID=1176198 RepID=A0A1I6U1J1_9ACTN|nr:alpha/beta hydrolase [Streptomyces harbinensis]SFS95346.1 TAP-like protein [Streptomyces harbinensis]